MRLRNSTKITHAGDEAGRAFPLGLRLDCASEKPYRAWKRAFHHIRQCSIKLQETTAFQHPNPQSIALGPDYLEQTLGLLGFFPYRHSRKQGTTLPTSHPRPEAEALEKGIYE